MAAGEGVRRFVAGYKLSAADRMHCFYVAIFAEKLPPPAHSETRGENK